MRTAKIVQFPQIYQTVSTSISFSKNDLPASKDAKYSPKLKEGKMILHGLFGLVWLVLAILWPLLNWLGALDVLFQWVRALYYVNTPAIHATWQAGMHTAGYLLVCAFVYLYRPNGL